MTIAATRYSAEQRDEAGGFALAEALGRARAPHLAARGIIRQVVMVKAGRRGCAASSGASAWPVNAAS